MKISYAGYRFPPEIIQLWFCTEGDPRHGMP